MNEITSHKDLKVWQEAMNFVVVIYEISESFPSKEVYGLTSQLRRASVSIPSNIAEGAGRRGNKEFIRFLYIALGSLSEVETQLEIAYRLKYLNEADTITQRIYFIRKMLSNLIKSLH
ncbi:four helix bundle protein [Pontimicrobium aquaticum]|uniref:Four helix bundle protein n=1 Tax=Pontimicrobium aquaticum TaxID=2565367 RepID=A0A4U0ESL5_9FLAO|nr:four helix bundle protein [Pontimicrobium aquaticum]TJY34775.1 four helix bundle protein [Pontimicrobium aquaticum]